MIGNIYKYYVRYVSQVNFLSKPDHQTSDFQKIVMCKIIQVRFFFLGPKTKYESVFENDLIYNWYIWSYRRLTT